jgi:hypothetical protein
MIRQMTAERWSQIQELYQCAVDLRGEERAAVLAQASPDVRQEVEAMLAEPSGSKLLDRPVWEALLQSSASIALGTQLGAYRIETVLGEGGMGVVYRALDTKFNRPVAVKFLSADLADTASRRRFQREALKVSKDWPTRPVLLADLAHAYTVFGNKQGASRLLAELTELSKRKDVNPWEFAIVYTGMGDKDRAFEWLDKAYNERRADVAWIKAEPRMDPLRSDPRYKELLLRLGLPE